MTFYISPPHGKIPLARLEHYAHRRLEFLLQVVSCNGNPVAMKEHLETACAAEDSDCLIEGSAKDAVSHFILRLACCENRDMKTFLDTAENLLFNHRISCMTADELLKAVKPLHKLMRSCTQAKQSNLSHVNQTLTDVYRFLSCVTSYMSWDDLIQNYSKGVSQKYIFLPFQFVTDLVAKRTINVKHGYAEVPCTKLCDILSVLFGKLLNHGMELAKKAVTQVQEDTRVENLFGRLKAVFLKAYPRIPRNYNTIGLIRLEEVDHCTAWFPPCMKLLHNRLRARHRLKHADRIQYTLFLKEVGLPLHEAVEFWRQEYSHPGCSGQDGCMHTWQNSSRRYTYSIRHLYGLEGSCINYRSHSCATIQGKILGPAEIGGCPFQILDMPSLKQQLELDAISKTVQDQVADLAAKNNPCAACHHYLVASIKQAGVSTRNTVTTSSSSKLTIGIDRANQESLPCECGTECTTNKTQGFFRKEKNQEMNCEQDRTLALFQNLPKNKIKSMDHDSWLQQKTSPAQNSPAYGNKGEEHDCSLDKVVNISCRECFHTSGHLTLHQETCDLLESPKNIANNAFTNQVSRKRQSEHQLEDPVSKHNCVIPVKDTQKRNRLSTSMSRRANPNFKKKVVYFPTKNMNATGTVPHKFNPGLDNVNPGLDNVGPGLDNVSPGLDNVNPGLDNVSPERISNRNNTSFIEGPRSTFYYKTAQNYRENCNLCCVNVMQSSRKSSPNLTVPSCSCKCEMKTSGASLHCQMLPLHIYQPAAGSFPGLRVPILNRPVDYYQTYRDLLEGLSC